MKRQRALIHIMITKQQLKNEQIKRKQACFVSFVKMFKFDENKIIQKNFQKIIKRFLGKPTGHDDHYMINMGS